MRYLWAFLFWTSALLTTGMAYVTWLISEGATPARIAVLIAAFITATLATTTALTLRQLVRASSKK
jgi:xanthine/CO dehydrogenase XdhC/CoxF family maturation factor